MITSNDNINDNTLKMITYMIPQNMSKCYHFSRSAIVIIFMLSFSLVHILCYHFCYHLMLSFMLSFDVYMFCVINYVIFFRVLSFMLSFAVIIFQGQQMLSFLCYPFSLYIFCVIISVII
jgi:hypothetical protein